MRNQNGTIDGISALAAVSGLQRADIFGIAEQVKKNHAALNGCAGHAFTAINPGGFMTKFRCANCNGEVDHHAHHWYVQGRKHAGAA